MSSHAQTPFLPNWVQTENVSIPTRGSLNTWAVTPSLTADPIRSAMLSERTLQLELRGRILKERRLPHPRATRTLAKANEYNRAKPASQPCDSFSLIARFLTSVSRTGAVQ